MVERASQEAEKHLEQAYGINFVRVADIAGQLFCEKKVELGLLHPEIEKGASQRAGIRGHRELAADASRTSRKEFFENLAGGKKFGLRESSFYGQYRGIPILGKPDFVYFGERRPLYLVDYKFSPKREAYPDHRLQVDVYGMLLSQWGLDTSELVTMIAFVSPAATKCHLEPNFRQIYKGLRETVLGQRTRAIHRDQNLTCFAYPFGLDEVSKRLDDLADFWLGLRPALPTRHANKCSVCEFNRLGLCESALTKPKEQFAE